MDETHSEIGERLYALVEAYAALGEHRTGTPVDDATLDWLADALAQRGAAVERLPFEFDRYDATAQVRVDGTVVPSLPLYYQGLGELTDDAPHIAELAALERDRTSPALVEAIAAARAAGARSLVVATAHPLGELQAPNRAASAGDPFPVVLVPGRVALAGRDVRLELSARVVPGRSANLVATFGDPTRAPLVIATPLTGWFGCAAERGTGIALAIALAERIAARHPVRVVASPGHELLPHIGLTHYLSAPAGEPPRSIVHLGANVALGRRDAAGGWQLIETRAIGLRGDTALYPRVARALEPLAVKPTFDPPRWLGEAALWADAMEAPLLSFVGIGPHFHTPADTPANTTSPALMQRTHAAIVAAVRVLLGLDGAS